MVLMISASRVWREAITDYVALTKPRIMSLLLVTALGGAMLAAEGLPAWPVLVAVLVGGALASGGASALNHCLDADVDQKMRRTSRRPVANLRVSRSHATVFGIVLNVLAFSLLWTAANLLAAILAIVGTLFYIIIYTWWLKRTTAQNIVIGGAAGAIPPLVGWAAVTGGIGLPALYLFALVFFWTPPHFWALALLIRDDYAAAGIPMLPVVEGEGRARLFIFLYTLLLLPLTLLLYLVTPSMGSLYLTTSLVLGMAFIAYAWLLLRRQDQAAASRLYRFSLLYLGLMFLFMMVDASV